MASNPKAPDLTGEIQSYFDCFSGNVFRLGLRITRNEADAEEVRQETFVRLQEQFPKLDLTGNMAGWIFRTATNIALKIRQHRFIRSLGEEKEVAQQEESRFQDDFPMDIAKVFGALDRLPEADRDLILDRFRDGRTPSEIAMRIGIPPGTVRVRLFRAMELLRDALRAKR